MIKKILAGSLLPVMAFAMSVTPALASHWSSSNISVDVDNSAYVKNIVNTDASTGGNVANGGNANGGNANGGNGGVIVTGNADAISTVLNDVNSTYTKVTASCGCRGNIDVDVDNNATVKNYVNTDASTGGNTANGGDATGSSSHHHHHSSTANAGDGGTIVTGNAYADGAVGNLVNSTVTRTRR